MKLGMVFEGGASRTAFSCGVMDAFLEEELMPDYFIGVSAGIAFGVSYLSKQKGRNLKLLEEYMADKRYMGLKYLFDRKKKSIITSDSFLTKYRISCCRLTTKLLQDTRVSWRRV